MEQWETALAVRSLPLGGAAASLGGWAKWAAGPHQTYDITPPFSDQRVLALNHYPIFDALGW